MSLTFMLVTYVCVQHLAACTIHCFLKVYNRVTFVYADSVRQRVWWYHNFVCSSVVCAAFITVQVTWRSPLMNSFFLCEFIVMIPGLALFLVYFHTSLVLLLCYSNILPYFLQIENFMDFRISNPFYLPAVLCFFLSFGFHPFTPVCLLLLFGFCLLQVYATLYFKMVIILA